MRAFRISLPFVLLTLFSLSAQAQAPEPEQHPRTAGTTMQFPIERGRIGYTGSHTEGILGRCFPNVNLHGGDAVHVDYVYTGGVFNNARGGFQTRSGSSYIGLFELGMTFDTEKLGLWKNGTFYMHSLFSHGPNPSRFVGDYQGVAVPAYETPAQVSEYWYEHRFLDDIFIVKAGKQDAGADYFYLEATADFINSSGTCVPGTCIPTAPDNAWGVSTLLRVTDDFCLRAGFFDANANANKFWMSESGDVYSAYQAEYHYDLYGKLPGFVYAGAWYDNSKFELLTDPDRTGRGNYGYNIGFEQMLYRRHVCDDEDMRGLTFFFQYSSNKKDRNELKGFWGLGVNWLGLFESRPDDIFGLGLFVARFSDGFRRQEDMRYGNEKAYEIYYKMQLTENIALQPVFQYVVHPSGTYRNSFVPGLVFQLVF